MPFIKGGKGIVGPNAAVWDQIRAWLYGIEKRSEEYRDKDEETKKPVYLPDSNISNPAFITLNNKGE